MARILIIDSSNPTEPLCHYVLASHSKASIVCASPRKSDRKYVRNYAYRIRHISSGRKAGQFTTARPTDPQCSDATRQTASFAYALPKTCWIFQIASELRRKIDTETPSCPLGLDLISVCVTEHLRHVITSPLQTKHTINIRRLPMRTCLRAITNRFVFINIFRSHRCWLDVLDLP